MKITELRTFVVGNPPPSYGGRYFILLTLTTADGVKGVGEVYVATMHPSVVVRAIEDVFDRHVAGSDPFRIEALFRTVQMRGYTGRPDVSLIGVLSGIEMACWDIVGKAVGKPAYELLGGLIHERLRAYTYLYPEPGDSARRLHGSRISPQRELPPTSTRGFTAVKFDPVGPYSAFDPRQPSPGGPCSDGGLRRAGTGGRRRSLRPIVGTHGQLTPAGAIRLARRLERFDPLWLEEPVPPDSPEQMATVARATSIPVATGERLTTKHEFSRVLAGGAAAILQPNLGRVGGLLEAKKIAGMAEAHYAQIAPHLYCGPIVGAANIQLAACTPNFLVLEGILDWGGFHAELLTKPLRWEDGFVLPPTEPGLGVELDEEVAARHPYDGDDLHLLPARRARRGLMRVGFVGVGRPGWAPRDEPRERRVRCRRPRSRRRGGSVVLSRLVPSQRARLQEAARVSDTVITCLPAPDAVARVVAGDGGVLNDTATRRHVDRNEHERPRRAPATGGARRASAESQRSRHQSRAACTSLRRARSRSSSAATRAVLDAQRPLLEAMGSRIFHVGALGSASDLKVITNMLAFVHLVACGEALMLAKRSGLDLGPGVRGDRLQLGDELRPRDGGTA